MTNPGFRRILLATDGTSEAEAAARLATALAETSAAAVRVVHVWTLEVHHRHGIWDVEMRSEAEKMVAGAVERLRTLGVTADSRLARADENHVGAAIAEAAREYDADLVVVGSRGLSDWRSMFVQHSVGHRVLCAVDCPVLFVREAGASIFHEPSRVLLAIAGGDDVAPGVRAAIAAASTPGSKVMAAHVVQAVFSPDGSSYVESEDEIQNTVETAASMVEAAGIAAETEVAAPGPVAHAIAAMAWRWQADIIVIGSSRMSDVASIIFGSVTHDLLRTTRAPVLAAERVPS